jgi:hypothetical protein
MFAFTVSHSAAATCRDILILSSVCLPLLNAVVKLEQLKTSSDWQCDRLEDLEPIPDEP